MRIMKISDESISYYDLSENILNFYKNIGMKYN